MSGGEASEETEISKLLAMEEEVDSAMVRRGVLPPPETEANIYVNMNRGEMDGMTPDEIGVAGFEIARLAFYTQSVINFYRRRVRMCDDEIKRLVGHRLDRGIYGLEEKWIDAIARDPVAGRWRAIRDKAQRALTTIEEYPARLHQMSRAALEMGQSRRQSHGKV